VKQPGRARTWCVASALLLGACSPSLGTVSRAGPADTTVAVRDTTSQLIPAGFGTLRQDDIALRVQQLGLQVRAIPLDETVIRVLSPDSYRALRELVASQRSRIADVQQRTGMQRLSLWYVSFFGVEQGETRFSPMEFIITNVGRDFRPLDVVPLSPGFGLQRLRQREVQHGLYIFDGQVDVNQPLTIAYETARNAEWPVFLQRVERERALVRSRARGKAGR
jgi:hypothetical protein